MPKFQWYDVMSEDQQASESFYQAVMGWHAAPAEVAGGGYTVFSLDGVEFGGAMCTPEPMRKDLPHAVWSPYMLVDDLDAYVNRIIAAGGSIFRPAWDTPGVGRFAVPADPDGARFVLMQPESTGSLPSKPFGAVGFVGWHELMTENPEKALAFYLDVFGWKKGPGVDMGEIGLYQQFLCDDIASGGIMKIPHAGIPPHWKLYFTVDAIGATVSKVTENGGQLVMGPAPVPGGMWIAQCIDPQGAHFGLTAANP